MSAYICQPELFGLLGAYAAINQSVISAYRAGDMIPTAQRVAMGLAKENIRSVAHRYPDTASGSRPGPSLNDEEIIEAAALYAAHFATNRHYVRSLKQVQLFKLIQCLDYQSCETDDWETTDARQQLTWIESELVRSLPGYESARWEYEASIPEIEALYATK